MVYKVSSCFFLFFGEFFVFDCSPARTRANPFPVPPTCQTHRQCKNHAVSVFFFKGNCNGKKIMFFIPSIDIVCGTDAQEKN